MIKWKLCGTRRCRLHWSQDIFSGLQVLKEDKLGPGVLLGIAMPIISQMIVEGRSEESHGHELKDADKDRCVTVLIRMCTVSSQLFMLSLYVHEVAQPETAHEVCALYSRDADAEMKCSFQSFATVCSSYWCFVCCTQARHLCRETNVVDVAVQTLGEMASHMLWPHYQQLLGHFLKAMQRQGEANKASLASCLRKLKERML